jgi:hypothetical protein
MRSIRIVSYSLPSPPISVKYCLEKKVAFEEDANFVSTARLFVGDGLCEGDKIDPARWSAALGQTDRAARSDRPRPAAARHQFDRRLGELSLSCSDESAMVTHSPAYLR